MSTKKKTLSYKLLPITRPAYNLTNYPYIHAGRLAMMQPAGILRRSMSFAAILTLEDGRVRKRSTALVKPLVNNTTAAFASTHNGI